MELIFFPLIILMIVGLAANSFQSSSLQTVPILPTPYCTGTIEPGECYPTNVNGCDLSVSGCNFTAKTSFPFLNQNSPFTALITGHFGQFINDVVNPALGTLTPQPFTYFESGSPPIFAICANVNGTAPSASGTATQKFTVQCSHTYQNSTHVAYASSLTFANSTAAFTGNYNCTNFQDFATWATTRYVYWGCSFLPANPSFGTALPISPGNNNETWGFLAAVNGTDGNNWQVQTNVGGAHLVDLAVSLLLVTSNSSNFADSPQLCVNAYFHSSSVSVTPDCRSWINAIGQTVSTNSNANGFAFLMGIGFIAGIVFLILGLGLGLNVQIFTTGFGLTPDSQGTKLMQSLGIGLVTWSFIYSEFGASWLPFLPFNLGTIGFVTLTIMYFAGLYWRLFSYD